ncbi:unnamed protein product [Trichobilharzia regenti]|nr:unnamed protein product [Trichobilharzia regenti]
MASSALAGLLLAEQEHTSLNYEDVNSLDTQGKKQNGSIFNKESDILENSKITEGNRNKLSAEKGDTSGKTNLQLMTKSTEISRLIDQPWRGAEAYHYAMLAEKQLYTGSINRALRTAQLLKDYEDILDPCKIYSLIALCSIYAKCFATCSKAFIKLENLTDISQIEQNTIKELAVDIFSK